MDKLSSLPPPPRNTRHTAQRIRAYRHAHAHTRPHATKLTGKITLQTSESRKTTP